MAVSELLPPPNWAATTAPGSPHHTRRRVLLLQRSSAGSLPADERNFSSLTSLPSRSFMFDNGSKLRAIAR